MTRIIALALVLAAGTAAVASGAHETADPAAVEAITAQLTAEGYELREIEVEDGQYEVYALKDGTRYEIYLDSDFSILKSEIDD